MRFLTTNRFEKEYRKMQKQGRDVDKLDAVMDKLINEARLPSRHRDHLLSGDFKDRRECHIEPDWLLIYKIERNKGLLVFERTGSHADLFE